IGGSISSNSAQGNGGGVATTGNSGTTPLYRFNGNRFSIVKLSINNNVAAGAGGGLFLAGQHATNEIDEGVTIDGNTATGANGNGGGVAAITTASNLIAHSTLTHNTASADGG